MRVAIVGAGPIGLEAAARLFADGHDIEVYEAGEVGDSLRAWGHVRAFTPWARNTTALGRSLVPDGRLLSATLPTGDEIVDRYLRPLAARLPVHAGHRVRAVGRIGATKSWPVGADRAGLLRLVIDGPDGEFDATFDAVLDCGGVAGKAIASGLGGGPALGERRLGPGRIQYGVQRVEHFAGKRVAVVGDGTSACAVLLDLAALDPAPQITWLGRAPVGPGFRSGPDDPLPERFVLHQAAAALARQVDHRTVGILSYQETPLGVKIALSDGGHVVVDAVSVCCGHRPDRTLAHELQVSFCPRTDAVGPVAARLDGGATDVLDEEPGFFVLGNKSYGRRPFLFTDGHAQIDEVAAKLGAGARTR